MPFETLDRDMVAWKKCYVNAGKDKYGLTRLVTVIVKLRIPKGATVRFSYKPAEVGPRHAWTRMAFRNYAGTGFNYFPRGKLRSSSAWVERIETASVGTTLRGTILDGSIVGGTVLKSGTVAVPFHADRRGRFKYVVGEKVVPTNGFSHEDKECERGIHFFRTKKEAIDYGR